MKIRENMIISYRTSKGFDMITGEVIEPYISRCMILKIYTDKRGIKKAKIRNMDTGIEISMNKLFFDVLLSNKDKIVSIEEG